MEAKVFWYFNMASWDDLPNDLFIQILMRLNIMDLLSASNVCIAWQETCLDPRLWKKIDLAKIPCLDRIRVGPFVLPSKSSSLLVMTVLDEALRASCGAASCLIFNSYVQTGSQELIDAAVRSTGIIKLVLPGMDLDNMYGFYAAAKLWKQLEFVTIRRSVDPVGLFKALGENCKSLTHLKVLFPLKVEFAKAICQYLPNITALSIRYTAVHREAILELLDGLESLEVLNLSHILVVTIVDSGGQRVPTMRREMDTELFMRAKRQVRNFVTCQGGCGPCAQCSGPWDKASSGVGASWYQSEEDIGREDEVPCFEI